MYLENTKNIAAIKNLARLQDSSSPGNGKIAVSVSSLAVFKILLSGCSSRSLPVPEWFLDVAKELVEALLLVFLYSGRFVVDFR